MIRAYAVADVYTAEDRVRAGLPDGELMQRAARGLAEVVSVRVDQLEARRLVVLAGPGDNGGDALWAASFLGGTRDVGDPDDALRPRLDDVAVVGIAPALHAEGLAAAQAVGVPVHLVAPDAADLPTEVADLLAHADVVLDGLLGIGGRPGLRDAMAAAVDAVADTAYLISVDLPSGADPAGEEPLTTAVFADETVTFGMAKPVHLLPATVPAVGLLTMVDIGVDMDVEPVVERLDHRDVGRLWPVPGPLDDKYSRGVVAVVAGSDTYPGAAVLCSAAAVAAGAGMVRYLGPPRATDLVLAACPEVVPGPGQVQAGVVGSGIVAQSRDHPDRDDHQVDTVRELLSGAEPLVVDAGGLEILASWLGEGNRRTGPTLLTPHAGELARLLTTLTRQAGADARDRGQGGLDAPGVAPQSAEVTRQQVEASPLAHARRAAEMTGCTVLLKGSTTLVVDPDPSIPARAQTDAPAWLATAGAGDVLAGLAGALLAAGLAPRDAGSLAALVHGVAADVANPGGPVHALAVANAIPSTVAQLLQH